MRQAWRHGPQPPLPQLPRIQVKAPLLHVATRTHVAKKTPVYATPTRTSWPWLVVPVGLYEARFRAAQGLPKLCPLREGGIGPTIQLVGRKLPYIVLLLPY